MEIWKPLSVREIQNIFKGIPVEWWIAGGWAIDLFLGEITREHEDIDVVILRKDHLTIQKHLEEEWDLYKAVKGELITWKKNETLLSSYDNIWVKKKGSSTWAFQVMIFDTDENKWVYKRKKTIKLPLEEIGLQTTTSVPYLRPEIQLLYKGGSSLIREKDHYDLHSVLPKLCISKWRWLRDSLNDQFPEGHEWMDYINHREEGGKPFD
ncbi:nucleotidyltransferase domain-containing protein [Evansella sp. AB-rgal1]|uniref:nucleotidyltransferase domain-containing protein n=1 Tax=Evansella sp. AB-rgal1 TaxID=3242696 RepID=UPI00359F00A9